ncbi:MAG: hypothetical protein ACE5FL_14840, partial [Myxococcota bacterium]
RQVGRLYGADLAGAGCGGLGLLGLLHVVDPAAGIFVLGAVGAMTAAAFAGGRSGRAGGLALAAGLSALAAAGGTATPPLAGDPAEKGTLFERWNAFSRITVIPAGKAAFGWGFSARCPVAGPTAQRLLFIDRAAATPLTAFDGDLSGFAYLDCDVTNAAYQIRRDADVMVIGVGGGRDVLAALQSGQRSVTAAEVNGIIVDLLRGEYADFVGDLTRHPRVTVVEDEGRSFAARSDRHFDIIQASLVDTYTASTSGAFSLTESSIYTVEGWKTLLDRLTETGILTMSRWFYYREPAFETMRLVALAREALDGLGIGDHADKVVVVAGGRPQNFFGERGTGTVLVKKVPFEAAEIEALEAWAEPLDFQLVFAPGRPSRPVFDRLMKAPDLDRELARLPVDVSAPTDDRPFFFLMRTQGPGANRFASVLLYTGARETVVAVLTVAAGLSLLVILLPLAVSDRGEASLRGHLPGAVFFLAIGTAFMLIEIAQVQRLTVLLGHPIYSLSIVLSTLLVSSGIGSSWIGSVATRVSDLDPLLPRVGGVLLAVLGLGALLTGSAVTGLESAGPLARFAAAVALLAPPGFLMGTLFPLGMTIARRSPTAPTAWFWALNGTASTLASIAAVLISIDRGINASYLAGLAAYALALPALALYGRRGAAAVR